MATIKIQEDGKVNPTRYSVSRVPLVGEKIMLEEQRFVVIDITHVLDPERFDCDAYCVVIQVG